MRGTKMRLGQFIRKQCFVLSILIVSSLSYAEVVEQTVENKQLTKFILDLGPIFADYNKGNDNFISGRANTKPVKKMVSGEELVTEYQVSSKIYLSKENFKRVKDRVTNLTKTNSTTEQIKDLLAKAADNRIESVDLQSKGYFTLKKDYSGEWEQAEAKIKMANDDFLDALNKLQN